MRRDEGRIRIHRGEEAEKSELAGRDRGEVPE